MKMQDEMDRLKAALEDMGVEYEEHEGGMVTFSNGIAGDCCVFPSQTYDGKLLVRYPAQARVDTAMDVLIRCGVLRDGVE